MYYVNDITGETCWDAPAPWQVITKHGLDWYEGSFAETSPPYDTWQVLTGHRVCRMLMPEPLQQPRGSEHWMKGITHWRNCNENCRKDDEDCKNKSRQLPNRSEHWRKGIKHWRKGNKDCKNRSKRLMKGRTRLKQCQLHCRLMTAFPRRHCLHKISVNQS